MSASVASAIINGNEHVREEERGDNLFCRIVRWDTELIFRGGYDLAWIFRGRNGQATVAQCLKTPIISATLHLNSALSSTDTGA